MSEKRELFIQHKRTKSHVRRSTTKALMGQPGTDQVVSVLLDPGKSCSGGHGKVTATLGEGNVLHQRPPKSSCSRSSTRSPIPLASCFGIYCLLHQFAGAPTTKCHGLGADRTGIHFLPVLEARSARSRGRQGWHGEASLPNSQMTIFPLGPHVSFILRVGREGESSLVSLPLA